MLTLQPDQPNPEAEAFCTRFLASRRPPRFVLGRNEYAAGIARLVEIDGFIDDVTADSRFMEKPILKMHEVPPSALVVSTAIFVEPLTAVRRLRRHGLTCLDYFHFQKYSGLGLISVGFMDAARRDIEEQYSRYQWIHSRLQDKRSRMILDSLLNFRFSGDLRFMMGFGPAQDRQYFEDLLPLHPGEVFVDAGGFDGQTTLDFIQRCPEYRRIHFFEPETSNIGVARARLAAQRDIVFHASGLDAEQKTLRFTAGGGSASRVSANGDVEIHVDRLDDIVQKPVSFVKMDIEGAEGAALAGARRHIEQDHPKLAICCYHKFDDLWRIPEQVLAVRKDYSVHLRHYTDGLHETVMYFIPSGAKLPLGN